MLPMSKRSLTPIVDLAPDACELDVYLEPSLLSFPLELNNLLLLLMLLRKLSLSGSASRDSVFFLRRRLCVTQAQDIG